LGEDSEKSKRKHAASCDFSEREQHNEVGYYNQDLAITYLNLSKAIEIHESDGLTEF
jgi:hypothetical protein